MKKVKKDKKGFTLVEVLVAIAILGILSTIAIAGIQTVMSNSRNKYYKSLREMIISAAKEYYSDNKNELPIDIDDVGDTLYVSTLVDQDYLDPVKDANGKACDDSSSVTVYKTGEKEYKYLLNLSCSKDPRMPKSINDKPVAKSGGISVVCNVSSDGKKANAYLTLTDRSDYRYEVLKKNKENGKWEEVTNKKGNIKDGKKTVNIPINYGSGEYTVRAETGSEPAISEASCDSFEVESPEPDCDGVDYEVSHVAKEWFKGTLKVTIKTDKEKMERYNVNALQIVYNQFTNNKNREINSSDKSNKEYSKNGKKTINDKILSEGLTEEYNRTLSKGNLSVFIYNDAGDEKECKLGEYWMDNEAPKCENMQPNETWTNRADAKVITGCNDGDVENGKEHELSSGCRQKTYEDSTEDEYADFNKTFDSDEIYIEDNVGNVATKDSNCRFLKRIDRTKPRCSEVSQYGKTEWGKDFKAWEKCVDDLKKGVTPSECTSDTVYQEEGAPDGETKTFTIKDNAGNTEQCVADKHRDNVPPICTGSTFSNWVNTSTKRAYADCKDINGAGISGCKSDRVWETNITDGVNLSLTVEDYAGNTASCTAEKKRDRVAPICVNGSFRSSQQTTTGTCSSNWTSTYTNPDPAANPRTVTQNHGVTRSFTSRCWINSTVNCSDALSGCTSGSYSADSSSRTGSGGGTCYYQGCCNNVRSADCSGVSPATITIQDNAGNKTYCDGTFTAPKPKDEPVEDNNNAAAACNLLYIKNESSANIQWITQPSVDVSVTWDPTTNISVRYEPGNSMAASVSGGNGNMNLHFDNGVYTGGKLVVTSANGGQPVECSVGNYYIDSVAPVMDPSSEAGFRYSVVGDNGAVKCINSTMDNRQSLSGPNIKITAIFKHIVFTDYNSGIGSVNYRFNPELNDVDAAGNPVKLRAGDILCPESYHSPNPARSNGTDFGCSATIGAGNWNTDHRFCFVYALAFNATDAAGNMSRDYTGYGNDYQNHTDDSHYE